MRISNKPPIITVCGSSHFKKELVEAVRRLTLEGNIVLSCPFYNDTDEKSLTEKQITLLVWLRKHEIELSDSIYVVNPGGYIGGSTMDEIKYATYMSKTVVFMEEHI